MTDLLIAGGGVIGLMLARELALGGAQVTLIERGRCAQESSWAGGGIVSPLYPWRYPPAITALASWSQSSYVHLAAELQSQTDIDPELRQKGMLILAVEDEHEALAWAERYHRPLTQIAQRQIYQLEPHLQPGFETALWMPEVGSIRNPRLGQSLRAWVQAQPNIRVLEDCEVTGFLTQGQQVLGLRTTQGDWQAQRTVIAGGAWSGELLAKLDLALPVEPVKGQMMVFAAPAGLIDRVVMLNGRYLIPRNDGQILVGSTLEHVGFDKQTTQDAYDSLYASALSMLPELSQYPVVHHWAGLRPGSPSGLPFIGQVPGWAGLELNTGHFRNGLVLAPASTRLHADLLLQRRPIIDPDPYAPAGRLLAV